MSRPERERILALRRAAGNAFFTCALIAIVGGAWLAVDPRLLTTGMIGGLVLFMLADLVAPRRTRD